MIACRNAVNGVGSQNAFSALGGQPTPSTTSQSSNFKYDGTAWSTGGNMIYAKMGAGVSGGSNSNVLSFAGANPANNNFAEEITCINPVNCGLYCFTKNLAPGATDSEGTPYGSSY